MEKVMHVPEVVLNSGYKMPLLGMGTAAYPMPIDDLTCILVDAIETGYRHFDTATLYGSEEAVGRAVAEAIERGIIKSRQQVFITSKLWCTEAHPQLVLPALKNTLGKLGLDYVDLYLIHWPISMKPGPVDILKFKKEDIVPFDMKGVWKAMEACCMLGLAKSIGVSNFSCTKLSQLLQIATIPPAVNQVEINVAWQQQKLLEYCKEKGVHVSAYSPLGAKGASWNSPIINDIATAKRKSIAQVALRWIYEQGASVIVKSFNKERMKQNLEMFDWELSTEDNFKIQDIPQKKGYNGEDFTHPNGPYKSVNDIWDGEI
ncbi:protein REDOX 2-like [Solanum verrucosum]|uniref:protein REDOX 2-like n=1 Tax=Solanum verrucosum TaxID=315347 RepID=UPI0020D1EBC7|nr:protein REDOX 2-like [Solanum verrucosum]